MKEHKTIEWLNTKTWYRLIKVFFYLLILISIVIFNAIIFSGEIKKLDENKTIISCNNWDKTSLLLRDVNIIIDNSYFKENIFDYVSFYKENNENSIEEILKTCFPSFGNESFALINKNIYDFQKSVEIKYKYWPSNLEVLTYEYEDYMEKSKNLYGNLKTKYLDFSIHLFDITPKFSYNNFFRSFFIGNLIIFIIFEFIRRCFYYIVFGSIRPKK